MKTILHNFGNGWKIEHVRPVGNVCDLSRLRCGADVKPEEGLCFQVNGQKPLFLKDPNGRMVDDCVVTYFLWSIEDGHEYWEINDESISMDAFPDIWKRAVIFPSNWRFSEADCMNGPNSDYAVESRQE